MQIGLLVIGAAAVAGVLVYNRVQERATRREAERAFGSQHADVLLKDPVERREPTLEVSPQEVSPQEGSPQEGSPQEGSPREGSPREISARQVSPQPPSRPSIPPSDPRIDYVLELQGTSAGALRPDWVALERRFARRAVLREAQGKKLHAALQMVSRNGVVSEAELLEFRSQVETMAAAHRASVSAPPMREALEAAQGLDRACVDVDVQIALHVLGAAEASVKKEGFSVAPRAGGVTLLLDLPRTPDLTKSYAAMVKAARELGGRVVDDNGNALDDRALAAIGAEVEAMRARLVEIGIEPGSPLAQRLFS